MFYNIVFQKEYITLPMKKVGNDYREKIRPFQSVKKIVCKKSLCFFIRYYFYRIDCYGKGFI